MKDDKLESDLIFMNHSAEVYAPPAVQEIRTGDGNRTLILSLGCACFTVELKPQIRESEE
jgi:hypothetical protein